jgi:hypothetical protein
MWWKFNTIAMPIKQDHVRSRVAGSTCEISGLGSFFIRMVGVKVDK